MQESMRWYVNTLRQQGYPPRLMRVGLNTGEVVLRSIRKEAYRGQRRTPAGAGGQIERLSDRVIESLSDGFRQWPDDPMSQ